MITASSGIQAITKHSPGSMTVTWVVAGVAAVAVIASLGYFAQRIRPPRRDKLSRLVADALQAEWATRLGTDAESVRSAVLHGQPADLRDRLAVLVADVEVSFELAKPDEPSDTTVRCHYVSDESVTTVTIAVPWERIPQPLRANYLRDGSTHASQHWSVPQPAQSAA
jgi:hypothetical protein